MDHYEIAIDTLRRGMSQELRERMMLRQPGLRRESTNLKIVPVKMFLLNAPDNEADRIGRVGEISLDRYLIDGAEKWQKKMAF